MLLPERMATWASWRGWRGAGPIAGSVAAHAVVGAAAVTLLAATAKPREYAVPAPPPAMAVELVSVQIFDGVPMPATPGPPERRDKTPAVPSTDPRTPEAPSGSAADTPADGSDGVYLPPAPVTGFNGPAGLRGLVESDPCATKPGQKPGKDCGTDWSGKLALGVEDTLMGRSKQDLAGYYSDFMPVCPYNVGCDGPKEWISTNGTRTAQPSAPGARRPNLNSAMAAGPAGLGGIHDTIGRLGHNPDHFDRGFGD